MAGSTRSLASIIVPVHDESRIILDFLGRLRSEGVLDDYEVVVACNACTDDTATLARSIEGVVVGETAVAGKSAGLNLGDELATAFPRIYLDVDVSISKSSLDAIVETLDSEAVLAAAPSLEVDVRGRSWGVRAYYRIWSSLSWRTDEMVGSGVYAASAVGRARFDEFPHDPGLADDLFFSSQFAPEERRSIRSHVFVVPSSSSLRELIDRRARILTLNYHTAGYIHDLPGRPRGKSRNLRLMLSRPGSWPAVVVYGAVSVISRAAARNRLRKRDFSWTGSQRPPVDDA